MKIAKEYKRGFTLTEVIVSIAIVSIVILAVSSTFLSIRRIEKQKIARENLVSEIRNIYNIFSSEPNYFIYLIERIYVESIYDVEGPINETTIITINYNSLFQPSETKENRIICYYSKVEDNNIITLKLEVQGSYQNYIKEEALTRTIKVWD
ncbi:MAG: PulJ/GspJ family protein [Bacilli bacterium]|jgi:prepilin-type N-terminal cleavage/methylation domain-containing protein